MQDTHDPYPPSPQPRRSAAPGRPNRLGPRHPRRHPATAAPAAAYSQPTYQPARQAAATPARQRTTAPVGGDQRRNLWDKTWKNPESEITIWQTPNVWLLIWAVFTTLSLFFNGHTSDILSWIASAGLIVWSLLEIFRGVDYFRRLLGLAVIIYAVAALIKTF